MSFVNGSEIFSAARKGHYAVGAFNTNNLEWTRATSLFQLLCT